VLSKPSPAHPVLPPKGEGRGALATPTVNGGVRVSDRIQSKGKKSTAAGRSGRFDEGTTSE